MPEQTVHDEDQIDRQLAELDANPQAMMDPTVRQLHAELETLASALKSPPPADSYVEEPACGQAVAQARSLKTEATAAPFAADIPQSLPERLEHFRILKLLGKGGMGAVYLAEDTRLGRQLAVKTLKPELAAVPQALERFLREARLAATLEHDNVVPIYHVGEADGVPFLAMPFLKGSSLEEMICRGHVWSCAQIVRFGIQIAEGLAAAHARGLIHRDIKPANLWVEPAGGGRVKILDFGLARTSDGDIGLTQSGTILGTPAYMAPEQAKGEKIDARADLYSLGVVLYRLATGRLPLQGTDTFSMLTALATQQPRPVQELAPLLPPPLADLIMKLLAKDREQRPSSASELAQTLQRIWDVLQATSTDTTSALAPATLIISEPQTTQEALPAQSIPRKPPRRWALAVAAGFLFLIGGGVLLQPLILRITEKDGTTREINLKPGDRIEIVEKPTSGEGPPKTPPEVTLIEGDPDREAAEYVLSLGGIVRINGEKNDLRTVAELPKGAFHLTSIDLGGHRTLADQELARLQNCEHLTHLVLYDTRITDAGLAHFKDRKGLRLLDLRDTQVTDAGLVHFKDCKSLTGLDLGNTHVTDAGLAHFKGCKNLWYVDLSGTRATDLALGFFKECSHLEQLKLTGTRVTPQGIEEFQQSVPGCTIEYDARSTEPRVVTDPDRKAADYVLSIGGTVHINGDFRDIRAAADLPKEPFRLTWVWLTDNTQVTDAGLVSFKHCKDVEYLNLSNTPVTDAGLIHFKNCKRLAELLLTGTPVSDAGLESFQDCKGLTLLGLARTRVTDAGLAHFKDCKRLTSLDLGGTRVTDAGLAHFKDCKGLEELGLGGTRVTDAGLAHFKDCKGLRVLGLDGTRVTDAGLAHFKDCKGLTQLNLQNTQVTDASLVVLAGFPNFTKLQLEEARISRYGYEQLKATMPKTQITWSEPNRRAAEQVLALGGTVEIAEPGKAPRSLKHGEALPDKFFQLRRVILKDCRQPLDKLFETLAMLRFAETDRLEAIDLSGTPVTDVRFLAAIHGLHDLALANTGLRDDHVAALPKVQRLVLDGNVIGVAGLQTLVVQQPNLVELSLAGTNVSDLAVATLAGLKKLKRLSLANTDLSDAALKHLKGLTALEQLDLRGTKVTADGAAALQKALPKCEIKLDVSVGLLQ